ncbi:MAG: DUF6941 family protein [Planctomycetota bacterium]
MPKPKPTVVNMSICDIVLRDQRTNNVSLINLFRQLHTTGLPALHPSLHVYITLTEGHGKYNCELKLLFAADNSLLMSTKGQIDLKDPLAIEDIDFSIHNLRFDREGRYVFEFWCDDFQVGSRFFTLVSKPLATPQPD